MLRASVILKNARQDKDLELVEISKKLKVSVKYLSAIESEIKSDFPQEPYCSLIIKDYANFLGLNGDDIISLFRRDFANTSKAKPLNSQKIFFTPQFTFKIAVISSILIFATYLVFEYVKFNRPPMLKINWPDIINQSSLEITGTTDTESTIRVNNDLVIVDATGNFQKKVNLTSDKTTITIESKSPSGKTTVMTKVYSK
jgi:cytoskeletal protein RodZ